MEEKQAKYSVEQSERTTFEFVKFPSKPKIIVEFHEKSTITPSLILLTLPSVTQKNQNQSC